jgi:hypothetical protein
LVIPKKIRDQKTGKVKEKRKAKIKFSLRVKIWGKRSIKNLGQEILWERKKKIKNRKMTKRKTKGKS